MKRNKAQTAISLLKKAFKDSPEHLNHLQDMELALDDMSWDEEALVDGKFPLPKEITSSDQVALFSDGACRGNPGPGSWGMMGQDHEGTVIFEGSGIDINTTNNRMELTGAIEALKRIKEDRNLEETQVFLYSDSKYVVDGINQWVSGWKKRGWRKADKKTPENVELWQELDALKEAFPNLSFYWVKGHAGHPQNEYCDTLANQALDEAGF